MYTGWSRDQIPINPKGFMEDFDIVEFRIDWWNKDYFSYLVPRLENNIFQERRFRELQFKI